MRRVSRRDFLATSSVALGTLPLLRSTGLLAQGANPVFQHGVASGDPLVDRVILWTRVTPKSPAAAQTVAWRIARDPKLAQVVARGELQTGAARDFTVKVDVTGLDPGMAYYYRFESAGAHSAIGRTRTLPREGVRRIRLGVVSCANLTHGYYNAYACLAKRPDIDAVLHLGDYFYEYGARPNDAIPRVPEPNKEIVSLQDYRGRHAQTKADPDTQEIHRQHPFIVVWDDHEFANNAWSGGSPNHNPEAGEGDWGVRRSAAIRAYYEWMPIREDAQTLLPRIYRSYTFGDLATLVMLDTRIVGRDQQVAREDVAAVARPGRSLLGLAQEHWLAGELGASVRAGAVWNVLGQQVMFAPQSAPGTAGANTDSWDGYRAARDRLFDAVAEQKVRNLAVLTGDVHTSWAWDLPRRPWEGYDKATGQGSLGVEFAGTSVTSASTLGSGPGGEKQLAGMIARFPHLHYVEGRYRGYFVVDLTRERLQADFYGVATVLDRSTKEKFEKGFVTESGRNHLVAAATPAPTAQSPDPAP